MGRITVFTSDNGHYTDVCRVRTALNRLSLPFVEINVSHYPDRIPDLIALTHETSVATPQVFFNTRHIGNAKATLKLLKEEWDTSNTNTGSTFMKRSKKGKHKYESAHERYDMEIASQPDPQNARLSLTDNERIEPNHDKVVAMLYQQADSDLVDYPAPIAVTADDADANVNADDYYLSHKKVPYYWLMEELKHILPRGDNIYKLQTYLRCFTSVHAKKALIAHPCIGITTDKQAALWGKHWQKSRHILDHVTSEHDFDEDGRFFFRLRCDKRAEILNNYTAWPLRTLGPLSNPRQVVEHLHALLHHLLQSVTDCETGLIDYVAATAKPEYALLLYSSCELQIVDLSEMSDNNEKLAFGINVCNLILPMAYMQVGFCANYNNACRLDYFNLIKFNIGGHLYSINEWKNGFLRGNRKGSSGLLPPFHYKLHSTSKRGILTEASSTHSTTNSVKSGSNNSGNTDEKISNNENSSSSITTASTTHQDVRAQWIVEHVDPRLHFALHWGDHSGCPVRVYSVENLNQELEWAALAYCEKHVEIDVKEYRVRLSKMFSKYRADFGCDSTLSPGTTTTTTTNCSTSVAKHQLPIAILPYLSRLQRQDMEKLVYGDKANSVKVSFADQEYSAFAKNIRSFNPLELKSSKIDVRNGIKHGFSQMTGNFSKASVSSN